jgi:subtilisin family serine protease
MLKRLFKPLRILTLALLAAASPSFAQNHYIVRLSNNGNILSVVTGAGMQLVGTIAGTNSLYVVNSVLPPSLATPLLKLNPAVVNVEVDLSVALPEVAKGNTLTAPNLAPLAGWLAPYVNQFQLDPYSGQQEWSAYLNQPAVGIIHLPAARQIATGQGTVAVLDTGIDFTHPALANSTILGWDFVNNLPGGYATPVDASLTSILGLASPLILDQSTTPLLDSNSELILDQSTTPLLDQSTTPLLDQSTTPLLDGIVTAAPINEYGHGTMVAGLVHLVAPTAKLLPVKIFDAQGGSSVSLVLEGIYYAVNQGAKVINMSFSMSQTSQELQTAIAYANAHGVIVVAAAGNSGENVMVYPAGYSQVEGVGSTDNQNVRSTFSNYGRVVEIAAPGEGVITTYPGNLWAAAWGTSFSAPMVSGGAALLVQLNPQIDQTGASQTLSHADAIGQMLGAGLLDLQQSLGSAGGH